MLTRWLLQLYYGLLQVRACQGSVSSPQSTCRKRKILVNQEFLLVPSKESTLNWNGLFKKMHSQNTLQAWRRAVVPAELMILPRNLIHMLSYTNLVKEKGCIFRLKKSRQVSKAVDSYTGKCPECQRWYSALTKGQRHNQQDKQWKNTHQGEFDRWHGYQQSARRFAHQPSTKFLWSNEIFEKRRQVMQSTITLSVVYSSFSWTLKIVNLWRSPIPEVLRVGF